MKRTPATGFTLIELLVVIGILGLLAVTLLPQVLESRQTADIFADTRNLHWHHEALESYKNRRNPKWPDDGGHKFVLTPWIKGVVGHTVENRDRYFTPGLGQFDPHYQELAELDPKEIWRDYDDITSDDTHYAGLAQDHYRLLRDGSAAIMANDNETGNTFPDGSINVLMASGSVRTLYRKEELKEAWNDDDPDFVLEVGPDSPIALLRTLRY